MPLRTYQPSLNRGQCEVTITSASFKFSSAARDRAQLHDIHWMRVHTDPDDRLVVFEPVPGVDRRSGCLKLGTSDRSHKTLTAKGLISHEPWIHAVANLRNVAHRRFEMSEYHGSIPGRQHTTTPWFIRLMPAFEESVVPSEVNTLPQGTKGIYRYRGGENGDEVVYIGKGRVRDRFQQERDRVDDWDVCRIEYSLIQDEQKALEWEACWIERFKQENNGRLPRYNRIGGLRGG